MECKYYKEKGERYIMANVKYSLKAKSETSARLIADTGEFKITIDEPTELGGTNQGPNPVQYVLAALCGCLNVVGHMIANEMGFELKGLEFEVEGDLNPAKLYGKPGGNRAGFEEIRVNILPDTDVAEDILKKWLETVKKRCPVSDNLENPTPVKISVK